MLNRQVKLKLSNSAETSVSILQRITLWNEIFNAYLFKQKGDGLPNPTCILAELSQFLLQKMHFPVLTHY